MAAKDFLRLVTGRLTQVFGVQVSAGVANAGDIPALDDTGKFDITMMPVGVTADTVIAVASEALASGDFVNLFLSGGVLKARKADATAAGKEANGFVLAAVLITANATVYQDSTNTSCTGLTIGTTYYLSAATPGLGVAVPPSATGNVVQTLGKAIAATQMHFEPDYGVILA